MDHQQGRCPLTPRGAIGSAVGRAVKSVGRRLLGPHHVDESHLIFDWFAGGPAGVMFDVGAAFGDALQPFAESGWQVHAFEPDDTNRARLVASYGDESNVVIVPAAVANEPGRLTFYSSPESPGISSLAPFRDSHVPAYEVPVITLGTYVSDNSIEAVDYLKIDVEGFEQHVLDGYDWRVKPRVIMLEFDDGKTERLGYRWTNLADRLTGLGYRVLVSEWHPVTRYGTSHRWRRFAPYPTSLSAPGAWGNLIGILDGFDDLQRRGAAISRRYHARDRVELVRSRIGAHRG